MRYLQHVEKFVDGMKVVEIPGASTSLSNPGYTFFCMHGYGANAYDLAGLSQYLNLPEGTRFIFPDGILKIDLGYAAGYEGRAWFPIDWAEIERIRREGGLRDLSKTLPAGMAEARDRIIEAMQKLECDPARTVIGGFSQGSMLATEIALHHKEQFAGLLIFSGTLVNRTGWENMAKAKFADQQKTLRFHQSHGRLDPVLPFQAAERLYELLTTNGAQGELHAFEGQHEIPAAVVETTNRWLGSLFSP
ncbi:MAG TPA: alpha/beta hydrolase-fold protein [Turneriella sp.]|nr:alpha/beta hydrolase-fold protein [Turneriella sp.]HNA78177.1 alpha/beta hydrolase-fold protein [Turneriella sp.]HNE20096.1 alpha/beta hydrolase-fold protein [Turneriella sp.]HNJ67577.1 alpha/beta hydrolase-fold protein [Turneriella sp.]